MDASVAPARGRRFHAGLGSAWGGMSVRIRRSVGVWPSALICSHRARGGAQAAFLGERNAIGNERGRIFGGLNAALLAVVELAGQGATFHIEQLGSSNRVLWDDCSRRDRCPAEREGPLAGAARKLYRGRQDLDLHAWVILADANLLEQRSVPGVAIPRESDEERAHHSRALVREANGTIAGGDNRGPWNDAEPLRCCQADRGRGDRWQTRRCARHRLLERQRSLVDHDDMGRSQGKRHRLPASMVTIWMAGSN